MDLQLTFIFSRSEFGCIFVDVIKIQFDGQSTSKELLTLKDYRGYSLIDKIICGLGSCTIILFYIDI